MADNENDVTQSIEVETYSAEQDVKKEAPESTEAKEETQIEAKDEKPADEAEAKDEGKKEDGVPEWAKRRFGELTKQRAEAERRAQALELELHQFRSQQTQQPASDDATQFQPNQQPAPVDPYALADQIATQRAFDTRCNEIYEKGVGEFQDFDAALSNFQILGGLPPALIEAADATGNPAKVLYELGKNPAEAERIMRLPLPRMGVELAKRASATPAAKPISKAPAPISPVDGGKRTPDGLSDDLDDHEWIARRQKEVEARRAAR